MTETSQAPTDEPQRSDWPVLQGRCRPDDLRIVDVAAALERKPRGHYAVEAVVAAAKKTLAEHGVPLPLEAAS